MTEQHGDSSASGFVAEAFEGLSRTFTDVEILRTSEVNVVAKGKRYGRWWLLKGLRQEVANEAGFRQRLRKELEILMALHHPGIVSAMGMEPVDGMGECIVMEYIEGATLKEWLQGTTTRKQRREVAKQLTEAVGYVHAKGIVHRDLKPENIMITGNGENVKLVDFGLADTDSHAILKQPAGTPRYMSPEQAQTAVADVRNDIYSLGILFNDMQLGYGRIVKKCLRPIGKRYRYMAELQQAMQARKSKGTRIMLAGLSVLALLLVGLVGLQTARLHRLTSQSMENHAEQEKLNTTITLLTDSLKQMAASNRQLSDAQNQQHIKRQLVENAISNGKSQMDKALTLSGLKQHFDTLSSQMYLNDELFSETLQQIDKARETYIDRIAADYTENELSEITYRLTDYQNKYGRMFANRYLQIGTEHER